MKTALLMTGEGYGNVIWSTPCAVALHEMGYTVDVLTESHWPDTSLVYKNSMYTRKCYTNADGMAMDDYDVTLCTRWAKTRPRVKKLVHFQNVDLSRQHEIEENFTCLRQLGYDEDIPAPFFADIEWVPNNSKIVLIGDPKVGQEIFRKRKYPYISELNIALDELGLYPTMIGSQSDIENWPEDCQRFHITEENVYNSAQQMLHAGAYVGQDCGITQIAATIGMPTLALFGPTRLSKNKPWGKRVKIFKSTVSCSPCQLTRNWINCKDYICMKSFTPDKVALSVKDLMEEYDGKG